MIKDVLILLVCSILLGLVFAYFVPRLASPEFPEQPLPLPWSPPVACTMDAKICPDGTAVGRTGPNCEFAPCPGE